jgi:hypothetical protein
VSGDVDALVLTRSHDLSPHNAIRAPAFLARFTSTFGSPLHITGDELFIATQSPRQDPLAGWNPKPTLWPLLIYRVPPHCVSRLATSPLQRVYWSDATEQQPASAPHDGVSADWLVTVPPFRNTSVQVSSSVSFKLAMSDVLHGR